jgi:hypothetical protein
VAGNIADWGSCALDIEEFPEELDDEFLGKASGVEITNSITALAGCVSNTLSYLLTHPAAALQDLGTE